jgi:hypothetical protein
LSPKRVLVGPFNPQTPLSSPPRTLENGFPYLPYLAIPSKTTVKPLGNMVF